MLKINIISMYLAIICLLIFVILALISKKKDIKVVIIISKISTYCLFISTIISRVLVELDVYNFTVGYYCIFVPVITLLIYAISKKINKDILLAIIMLVILSVCFVTNTHSYPYTYAPEYINEAYELPLY